MNSLVSLFLPGGGGEAVGGGREDEECGEAWKGRERVNTSLFHSRYHSGPQSQVDVTQRKGRGVHIRSRHLARQEYEFQMLGAPYFCEAKLFNDAKYTELL